MSVEVKPEAIRKVGRQSELQALKSNHRYRDLVRRVNSALKQSNRAREAGYSNIADKTLAIARGLCNKIEQLLCEDKRRALR